MTNQPDFRTALLTIRDASPPEGGLMDGVDTWSAFAERLQKTAGDAVDAAGVRQDGDDLLPCPFCGGLDLTVYSNADIGCWVSCVDRGLETPTETGTTPDDATKYWNTRATPQPTPLGAAAACSAVSKILCGEETCTDAGNWRCPQDIETADEMIVEIVDTVFSLATPQPARDAAEGAGLPAINDTLHTPEVIASLQKRAVAPPKPAPDAVREARRNQLGILRRYRTGAYDIAETALGAILALEPKSSGGGVESRHADQVHNSREIAGGLSEHSDQTTAAGLAPGPPEAMSAPVPPADGAIDPSNHHNALKCPYCNPQSLSFSPSGTGAAEPDALGYATRLLTTFVAEHFPPNPDWKPLPDLIGVLTQIDNAITIARDYKVRPATPTVRGDRELLEQCAKLARQFELDMSGSQLDDRDIENIQHGANVASNAIADAILSIHFQPGAGERDVLTEIGKALEARAADYRHRGGMLFSGFTIADELDEYSTRALSRQAPHSGSEGGR